MKRVWLFILTVALLTACQPQNEATEAATDNDPSLPRPLETAETTSEFRTEVDGSPAAPGSGTEEATEPEQDMKHPGASVKEGVRPQFTDGEYQAEGRGNNGNVQVTVVVQDGYIHSIHAEGTSETPSIFNTVIDDLLPRMIFEQRAQVDATSGATMSSEGVIEAVQKALDAAAPQEETE